MKALRRKVEEIIAGGNGDPILRRSLWGFSILYGGILRFRASAYRRGLLKSRRLPLRVASVGNLTAGGTGKTPMTMYLARALRRSGYRVAVASRGYGGAAQKTGGVVSDGTHIKMPSTASGDEPFLMAASLEGIPVLVGADRYRSGRTALARFHPDVLLLDDGFQHLKLKRDLDLVLLDRRSPFGNRHVLPRGPLRESLHALGRADAFVMTRCDSPGTALENEIRCLPSGRPVFRSVHLPYVHCILRAGRTEPEAVSGSGVRPNSLLQGRRVFAFSGIADNRRFWDTVLDCGGRLAGRAGFPDHHPYSAADLDRILRSARAQGADWIATTEKDFVRLPEGIRWSADLAVIGIEISFGNEEDAFLQFIQQRLGNPKCASS